MARIPSMLPEKTKDSDDDQLWEDLSEAELIYRSRPSSTTSTSFSVARPRRMRQRAAHIPTSPRRHVHSDVRGPVRVRRERTPIIEVLPPSPQEPTGTDPEPREILINHVSYYAQDVLGTVLRIMKIPICIFLVFLACTYALAFASAAIRSALAPLCSVPVVSLLCPAFPHSVSSARSKPDRAPQWADFPSLLNVERKTLEALLDETVEGPGLALAIKKAEMATSDLATLVRVSNLNSRDVLADSLGEFVKDARKVGRGLTRFSSRVGGAVDK
jgi:hypothetical protein